MLRFKTYMSLMEDQRMLLEISINGAQQHFSHIDKSHVHTYADFLSTHFPPNKAQMKKPEDEREHKHLKHLLNWHNSETKKNPNFKPDDAYKERVKNAVNKFIPTKSKSKGPGNFANVGEMEKHNEEHALPPVPPGHTRVHEDKETGTAIDRIDTKEGAQHHDKDTKWCTSRNDKHCAFDEYTQDAFGRSHKKEDMNLHVIHHGGKKWQFDSHEGTMTDHEDRPVRGGKNEPPPAVRKAIRDLSRKNAKHAASSILTDDPDVKPNDIKRAYDNTQHPDGRLSTNYSKLAILRHHAMNNDVAKHVLDSHEKNDVHENHADNEVLALSRHAHKFTTETQMRILRRTDRFLTTCNIVEKATPEVQMHIAKHGSDAQIKHMIAAHKNLTQEAQMHLVQHHRNPEYAAIIKRKQKAITDIHGTHNPELHKALQKRTGFIGRMKDHLDKRIRRINDPHSVH